MRRLPWHVTLRVDRRAIWTAVGVALGVAFAFASFAIPAGLRTETVDAEGALARPDAIISRADLAPFRAADLPYGQEGVGVLIVEATLADARVVTLVALEGANVSGITRGTARATEGAPVTSGTLSIVLPGRLDLTLGSVVQDVRVGRQRVLVDAADLRAIDARFGDGRVTYVLASGLSPDEMTAVRVSGYSVSEAPGIEPFFRSSGLEVASDLWLVVAFSTILVGLFVYEFMRSEIRERTREIGLWRALGMDAKDVALLLVGRGAALGLAGCALGIAAAVAALLTLRFITRSGVFHAGPGILVTLVLLGAFLSATIVGAAIPAWSAGRARVAAQMEARP